MPPEQEPLSRGWWVSKHLSLQKLSAQRKETDSRCQNVRQNGFGDCKRFDVYQVRYNFLRAIQMLDNAQASCIIHRATSRALDEDKMMGNVLIHPKPAHVQRRAVLRQMGAVCGPASRAIARLWCLASGMLRARRAPCCQ